jgi:hypothetical protein
VDKTCFESVGPITFQNVFYLKIYKNNIFFIFLKLFFTSDHQNNLKILKNINLKYKKNKIILIFFETEKTTSRLLLYPP